MRLPYQQERWRMLALIAAVVLLLLLLAKIAMAAGTSATVSWTHPTANTDGSPLTMSEIKETIVTWRRPGDTTVVGFVRVAAPATSTVVTGLVCGNFSFVAQTVVKTNDITSTESNAVLYASGVTCTPNPPSGLKAE